MVINEGLSRAWGKSKHLGVVMTCLSVQKYYLSKDGSVSNQNSVFLEESISFRGASNASQENHSFVSTISPFLP